MESINNMCRACLKMKETFTFFIHKNVSEDLFLFCTSVKVQQNDELSKALCDACHELLVEFSQYKRTCMQSNEALISGKLSKDSYENNPVGVSDNSLLLEVKSENVGSEHSQDEFYEADFKEEPSLKSEENYEESKEIKPKLKEIQQKRIFYFSCEYCYRRFVDADRYEGHKLMHEGKTVAIKCEPCNKMFNTWYGLTRHKKHVHTTINLERLRCTLCGKVSKTEQTLKMHYATHEKKQTMILCDVCGRGFKSKYTLKVHLKTHEKDRTKLLPCKLCENKFQSQQTLQCHLNRHKGKKFICDQCGHKFLDKFSLVKHLWRHEGKKLYQCHICSKHFADKSTLNDHKRVHSGEKPYTCGSCDKCFTTRRILTQHSRTHTGVKPYKCTICTQAFSQRGSLTRHMKVHDKSAPALVVKAHKRIAKDSGANEPDTAYA